VQARELTQTQSILQQQIKYLGDSIYQQGSMVIPGQAAIDPKTNYVQLQSTYNSIPINLSLLANQTIQGVTSGLKALVVYTVNAINTDPPTIYVKYLNTGTIGQTAFSANEVLTLVNSANGLAQVGASSPTGLAVSAQIDEGVYYVWGFFVRVEQQYLLLGKYTNIVSARIGLQIVESIITPEEDSTLNDNAQGSTNYAAPGAHRYKIDLVLTSKDISDTSSDQNFIEIIRVINSVIQTKITTDTYSVVMKELATRMADVNGDFAVRNFSIDMRESLDTSFVTEGTVIAASTTPATITLASSASAVDGAYDNMQIYLSNGSGAGQNFVITDYVGSTKTATLSNDFNANQVADTTTTYIISDPTKINRGMYPPTPTVPNAWPGPYGDDSQLAVGLESGRAYVDGYRIDTLVTQYVEMDKARDTAQAVSGFVPTPVGSYMFVKNVYNIPLPSPDTTANDFLTINFGSDKAGPGSLPTTSLGTARVHAFEYYQGTSPSSADAVFKMYLFDVSMNAGVDINTAKSYYLENIPPYNDPGNSSFACGDICAAFNVSNINGTGLIPSAILTGPSSYGHEVLVSYDSINNIIITEPSSNNALPQILTNGSFSALATGPLTATGTLSSRTQIFNTQQSTLIYPLPQQMVKTIRNSSGTSNTSYYVRMLFESTISAVGGTYAFNAPPNCTFIPYNPTDYVATIVNEANSGYIGEIITLPQFSYSGTPANSTIQFTIPSGPGSSASAKLKLMATLYKTVAGEKVKALTEQTLVVNSPTATMLLGKADVVEIEAIYDTGNLAIALDGTSAITWAAHAAGTMSPSYTDIKSQYVFDTGQRDYYYDVGSVVKYPAAPGPKGHVGIVFKYYAHSGGGDYFSVDSYTNQIDYASIPTYYGSNGKFYVLRDYLDFRPRTDDGQNNFSASGSSYSLALQPTNVTICDFQYYLSRIDKIYLDQYGNFNVIKGTSALNPQPPPDPIDGMMLYTIQLNPYTLNTSDTTVTPTKNPLYTMHDIGKLEDRIANLEYYTSLSQLETQTATYSVTDTSTGLDRFKNGFVVDNFTGHTIGNVFDGDYKCAIDPTTNQLRPLFIQNNNTMIFNSDHSSGYVNRSSLLMLPYTETVTIQQTFATDIINVNPFAVFTYYGDIALIPPTDTWKDTVQMPVINVADNSQLAGYQYLNQWSGATWGDWVTTQPGVGVPQTPPPRTAAAAYITNLVATDPGHWVYNGGVGAVDIIHIGGMAYATGPEWQGQASVQVNVNTTATTTQQLQQTRVGTETAVTAQITKQTINNCIVDVSLSPYIRSRRIQVVGRHFKPNTRLYPFFDGNDVSGFCRPYSDPQITPSLTGTTWTMQAMTWGGDYDPQDNLISGTSSDPNDTGQTATYLTGPLGDPIYSDSIGTVTLFFEIPCNPANEFRVGVRPFRLTDSQTNSTDADSYGDANYTAQGIIEQNQETITSIYSPEIITQSVSQSQTITQNPTIALTLWIDPLAQSFLVKETGGCYVTSIDVYFQLADNTVPITMQIRNMVNGYPGQDVVPFSEKTLYPNNPTLSALTTAGTIQTFDPPMPAVINVSDDASVPTSFVFDAPVYLNDATEYAFVLIANSVNYFVYTAKMGDTVIGSTNIVSTPPYLGNLFKSQNASTWVADPSQNLKFVINKAVFDPTQIGTVYFTNSSVQDETLLSLPFQTINGSNIVRVYHKAHMMPKGEYSNSIVTLSNVTSGNWNGLSGAQLSGNFLIDNVDLNSYTITVSAPATSTGRTGPDGVVATSNVQFDAICPTVNTLTPTGTAVAWYALFTSGKSVNINSLTPQEPYIKDTLYSPMAINSTSLFAAPRMLASDINETNNIVGATAYDRKSMIFQGIMATTSANLTPIIDSTRISTVLINNQIDDPTFDSYTITNMDNGVTVISGSGEGVYFDSQVVMNVVGVTGGTFTVAEVVTGSVSGAIGTVVTWDGSSLTLSDATGIFQDAEAVSGATSNTIGTCEHFQYLNTLTNWVIASPPVTPGTMDFSVFIPGYAISISGCAENSFGTPYGPGQTYTNPPVTILAVNGNQLTVSASVPFVHKDAQINIHLTQFVRYVAESGPTGCTTASRYITRQFNLATAANNLQVLFTINRPPGSYVDVYYRILAQNSTQAFSSIIWQLMELDAAVDNGESTDPNQFKEYTYTANNIGLFTAFSIKLVMRGGNSSLIPRIQDFRGIAST
jgi:hypothetical protein